MTSVDMFVTDRTGKRYAELSEATLQDINWVLNDIGSASFTIPVGSPGIETIQLLKRELQIWIDGVISWGGPIMRESGTPTERTYECDGLLSYFMKRIVDRMSLTYTSIDQLSIMLDLVRYAQEETFQANRNLYIASANVAPSGKIRSRNYRRDEHAFIFDLLKEFSELSDGAECSIEIFGDGRREFTPWYPSKGIVRNDMVLEWGRNITSYSYNRDAVPVATHVYATGGTSGDVKFENNYEDLVASAEYGVMQGIVAEGSQNDVNWLLDRATSEVNDRKSPVFVPEVTCRNSPVQILGVVKEGDWVVLRIQNSDLNISQLQRVTEIHWAPPADIGLVFSEVA